MEASNLDIKQNIIVHKISCENITRLIIQLSRTRFDAPAL